MRKNTKKIKRIKELIDKSNENICLVCGKDFDACRCWYSLADEYLSRIEDIIYDRKTPM